MRAILQKTLPYDLRLKRALPGIQPLQRSDWLQIDEAYDQQIAERERLLSVARGVVVQLSETARPAAEELLDQVLEDLSQRAVETSEANFRKHSPVNLSKSLFQPSQ